jgi:hypothetical protein
MYNYFFALFNLDQQLPIIMLLFSSKSIVQWNPTETEVDTGLINNYVIDKQSTGFIQVTQAGMQSL